MSGDVTEWLQGVMSQLSRQYQAEHQKASVVEITDKIFRMPLGSIITLVDELKKLCQYLNAFSFCLIHKTL